MAFFICSGYTCLQYFTLSSIMEFYENLRKVWRQRVSLLNSCLKYKSQRTFQLYITLLLLTSGSSSEGGTGHLASLTSITTVKLLSTVNQHCSVSIVHLKRSGLFSYSPEMLKVLASSSMVIGMLHANQTWSRSKYFAKKRNPCHLVLSVSDQTMQPRLFATEFQNLIQFHDTNDGIVMRDRDYFVFISSSMDETETVLLSDLREKLRYKIAFTSLNLDGFQTISILTVVPYLPRGLHSDGSFKWGQVRNLGFVNGTEMNYKRGTLFIDFTWNFHGYPIKMAVFNTLKPTYEAVPDPSSPEYLIAKRGFLANFTETIHAKLNFSCKTFLCHGGGNISDGKLTGLQLPNSTWIGCMGDVVYNRAHISLAAPVINRLPFVDFLPKHKYDFIRYVSRQPVKYVEWTAFYKAFQPLVWSLVAAVILLTSIFTWLGIQIKGYHQDVKLGHILYTQLKVLLSQDSDYPSAQIGVSAKLLILIWLLCSLILDTAYNSKLTSLMAIPNSEQGFPTNFKSLSASNFRVGAPKGFLYGTGGVILRNSKSPVMKKIYEKLEEEDDTEKCMQRALTENFACITWHFHHEFEAGVVFADSRGVSPFFEPKDMFNSIPLTQIVRKREVFKESYSYFLENLFQMGLIDKWAMMDMMKLRLERIQKESALKKHYVEIAVKSLKLSNFLGSFTLLAAGSLIGGFIFSLELGLKNIAL